MGIKGINPQQLSSWKDVIATLGESQERVLRALIEIGGEGSVEMIAKKLDRLNYLISPRVTELLEKQMIFDTGKTTFNESSGKRATVWKVKDNIHQCLKGENHGKS